MAGRCIRRGAEGTTKAATRSALVGLALSMLATLSAACGEKRLPASPPRAPGADEPLPARAESADDAVVAQVNGLPVYASCVAHQAAAATGAAAGASAEARRRQALDECIGFELLAQEAAARRLRDDAAVNEAQRKAAVSRLIELEIDDKVQSPAGFPPAFTARVLQSNRWRMHRVDYRASAFVRYTVPEQAPAGSPADVAAQAAAERLAAALADERGLYPPHLFAKAHEVAQGAPLEEGTFKLTDADRLVPSYAQALFTIPEIGRTSKAVRTQWGWDVLLWTEQLPPRDISEAELAAELFPDSRLAYFTAWAKATGRNVQVRINPEATQLLARLAAEPTPGAPPSPASPAAAPAPAPAASPALPAPAEARP